MSSIEGNSSLRRKGRGETKSIAQLSDLDYSLKSDWLWALIVMITLVVGVYLAYLSDNTVNFDSDLLRWSSHVPETGSLIGWMAIPVQQ